MERFELETGLHYGVSMDDYLRLDAVSSSSLGALKRSPSHLKAYLETPPKWTDPTTVGTAFHTAVEDWSAFEERYARGPCDNRTRKEWKEFVRELPGAVIPLRPSDWLAVEGMVERVHDHPAFQKVVASEKAVAWELTGLWEDEETGLLIKSRPDIVNTEVGVIADLKTARDGSLDGFSRAVANYGYHIQAALYRMGQAVLEPEVEWRHSVLIAVEKEPPFAVAVYRLMNDVLQAAEDEIRHLLGVYRDCLDADKWPGYDDKFVDITLPSWEWRRLEQAYYS